MPVAATEDQLALQASIRDWAKRAAPLEAVRGLEPGDGAGQPSRGPGGSGQRGSRREPPGARERCWRELAGLGVFGIALPPSVGGDGGTVADLAAAHEFLLTRCLSIAGGTTQILLSVVAERVLGLPREEAR